MNRKPSAKTKKKVQRAVFSQRFERALSYAARIHAKQRRKGTGKPYIGHLLAVTAIVIQYGGDEEMAIAALLHDAVEDQGGLPRLREIRNIFGKRVARIVDGCTDAYGEPKPPWLDRKQKYIARITTEPADTQQVSAADKLANVRDILADVRADGLGAFERFSGKRQGTLWYYRALITEFCKAGHSPLVDELDRVVTQLEALAP